MHDTAVDLGASCVAHKIHVVQSRDLAPDLAKQFDRLTDVLTKSLVDLSTRLKAVEEQPLPLPFAMRARAVAKHEDGIGEERLDALLADPTRSPLLAIKLAQRQGR